ncbi:MAG: hypothetical protein ACMVP2_17580 [Imperialibacter sp.]|uniref:hypothetical protein n=1 Tax=Imperialibacter sp. TaxID=2038411 RepID=UPI003A8AE9EA
MKTNVLRFFVMLLLLAGCQEQIELIEPQDINLLTEALTDDDLEMNDQGIPTVVFRTTNKGKHKVVVRDYSVVPDEKGKTVLTISSKDNHGGSEHLTLNFGKIDTQYSIPYTPASNGYEGSVITIDLKYYDSKGNLVQSHQYDAYVDEKGKTTLQAPILGDLTILSTGASGKEGFQLAVSIPIYNDPASVVSKIDIAFTESMSGMKPPEKITLSELQKKLGTVNSLVWTPTDPTGGIFNTTVTMADLEGIIIGEPGGGQTTIQKADFTGRIKRIRIRKRREDSYFRTSVVLDGNGASSIVEHVDFMVKTENGVIEQVAYPTAQSIDNDENGGTTYVAKGAGDMLETDKAYSVTAILMGFDGKPLSAFTEYVVVEGPCCGRIRRIRIRENNSGTNFRVIVDENADPTNEPASYVQVKFNNLYGNPAPTPETAILTLTKSNSEKGLNTYVYKPLTFEGKARPIETIYSITATMLRADGSATGEPYTSDVIVEEKEQEISIITTTTDGGKTWDFQMEIAGFNHNEDVLKVGFEQPYPGPEPVQNTVSFVKQVNSDNRKVYVLNGFEFKGDATGTEYPVVVYLNKHPIGLKLGISKGWESNWYGG